MAGIQNLAIIDDASGTTYGFGLNAFTADANYIVSVIATNMTDEDGSINVYIVPEGSTNYANSDTWAPIAYNLPLPAYNSYETFRFGVNNTDEVWVAGSAGTRYFVQGIEQA
jgi:hypothetical protein